MILKEKLKEIVDYQKVNYITHAETTERELLAKIDMKTSHVIVLSGIRRCGKSTLLMQLIHRGNKFLFVNFEDPRLLNFEVDDFFKLQELYDDQNKALVFYFDEIQNVASWESFVRTLHDQKRKVVITGSNSSMLSKELGTRLTGRHLSYEEFPFSYSEFLMHNNHIHGEGSFSEYMQRGGFPEYLESGKQDIHIHLFNDIISRDISERHGIRHTRQLRELCLYLFSNIGKAYSNLKLAKTFNFGSSNTVDTYVSYFIDCYLLFQVSKFSFSHKKRAVSNKKVYAIDTGLAKNLSLSFSKDKGRMLENLCFLHYRRQGYEIYYYKNEGECDFVICKNSEIKYLIQVCYSLHEANYERETKGLESAMKDLKKGKAYIVTMNQEDKITILDKKVELIPLWKLCSS